MKKTPHCLNEIKIDSATEVGKADVRIKLLFNLQIKFYGVTENQINSALVDVVEIDLDEPRVNLKSKDTDCGD